MILETFEACCTGFGGPYLTVGSSVYFGLWLESSCLPASPMTSAFTVYSGVTSPARKAGHVTLIGFTMSIYCHHYSS